MILMPLGVLVMLVLAAIAVDAALLHRTQAELENTAAALTNDVAAAVGTGSLFDEDADIRIDPGLVDRLASVHAAASAVPGTTCAVTFTNAVEPTAAATCDGDANLIFRGAVGLSDVVPLTATEESLLENG